MFDMPSCLKAVFMVKEEKGGSLPGQNRSSSFLATSARRLAGSASGRDEVDWWE